MDTSTSTVFSSLDFIFERAQSLPRPTIEEYIVIHERAMVLVKPYLKYTGMKALRHSGSGTADSAVVRAIGDEIRDVRMARVVDHEAVRCWTFLTQNGDWLYFRIGQEYEHIWIRNSDDLRDFLSTDGRRYYVEQFLVGLQKLMVQTLEQMEERQKNISDVRATLDQWNRRMNLID